MVISFSKSWLTHPYGGFVYKRVSQYPTTHVSYVLHKMNSSHWCLLQYWFLTVKVARNSGISIRPFLHDAIWSINVKRYHRNPEQNWKKYNCACRWHIAVVPKYLQADCRGGVVAGWWWWVGGGGWVVGGGSWVVVGGVRAGGFDTFYIFTKCYCSVMVNVFVWCVWLEYTHVDILINSRPSIQWF